jgi:hypothetical protein
MHGPDSQHLYAGSYSDEQLQWWAKRLHEWQGMSRDVFVYFNNDGHGTYASSEQPTIVCPSAFTFWPITYTRDTESNKLSVQLGVSKQYYWDGARYQEGAKR